MDRYLSVSQDMETHSGPFLGSGNFDASSGARYALDALDYSGRYDFTPELVVQVSNRFHFIYVQWS